MHIAMKDTFITHFFEEKPDDYQIQFKYQHQL